jgi:hypothetical protein
MMIFGRALGESSAAANSFFFAFLNMQLYREIFLFFFENSALFFL